MLNQGLLIYSWLTCQDIWKRTLCPTPLCKSRFVLKKIKSDVYKTANHLVRAVHQNLITLFGNKPL